MFANKENRAPLKTRIFYALFTSFCVNIFFAVYDYYQDRDFNILSALGSFIYYSVVILTASYFFLKIKKPKQD